MHVNPTQARSRHIAWKEKGFQEKFFLHFLGIYAGKDATDDFEDVGHSKTARDMLKDYYIGEIDASSVPKQTFYKPPTQPAYEQDKSTEFYIKILQFLVPLLILGLAIAVRYYTKSST